MISGEMAGGKVEGKRMGMGMGIAAGFGEGGGSGEGDKAVTITKLADEGGYKVELAGGVGMGEMESEGEDAAPGEEMEQVFDTGEEACKAAIAMLDSGGSKDEMEKAFMSDYDSSSDGNGY